MRWAWKRSCGGVLGDQRLEAADHLGVASRRELGVDRELDRAQVKLLEPPDLGARERLPGDVGERRAAPELERALAAPSAIPCSASRAPRSTRRSKRAASTASSGSWSS